MSEGIQIQNRARRLALSLICGFSIAYTVTSLFNRYILNEINIPYLDWIFPSVLFALITYF